MNILWRGLLDHPLRALGPLSAVALTFEVGQYWTEMFPGAHAFGEFVRNVAYALIGAVVFNWVIVEIPERRRRRSAYELNWLGLDLLVKLGPTLVASYRAALPGREDELNAWSKESIQGRAQLLGAPPAIFFGPSRVGLLNSSVLGVQLALDGMDSARFFFDPDVSHALALYPATKGYRQLQVISDGTGAIRGASQSSDHRHLRQIVETTIM